MKHLLLVLSVFILCSCQGKEEEYKEIMVYSTPTQSDLSADDLEDFPRIRIFGVLNQDDFKVLRACETLQKLDLSNTTIVGKILIGFKEGSNEAVYQQDDAIPFGAFGAYEIKHPDGTNTQYEENTTLQSILFPQNITAIGAFAFNKCHLTGNLQLPSSLKNIYGFAFRECSGLQGKLNLPAGLQHIGNSAFSRCNGFVGTLTLPMGMEFVTDFSFSGCTGFTEIKLHENVLAIGPSAFAACTGLQTLTLPVGVEKIEYCAFSGCTGLRGDLTLPESVFGIGMLAFARCGFDGTLTLNKGITILHAYAFDATNFHTIILPWKKDDPDAQIPPWNWDDSYSWFPKQYEISNTTSTAALTIPKGESAYYNEKLLSESGTPLYRLKEAAN